MGTNRQNKKGVIHSTTNRTLSMSHTKHSCTNSKKKTILYQLSSRTADQSKFAAKKKVVEEKKVHNPKHQSMKSQASVLKQGTK
jgi:hypothetical protein